MSRRNEQPEPDVADLADRIAIGKAGRVRPGGRRDAPHYDLKGADRLLVIDALRTIAKLGYLLRGLRR